MIGARKYAQLFADKEQHGRLLFISGEHARGKYFHIWVMPDGATANKYGHAPAGSVEVYGIRGGNPGWTEHYGWLHEGPWQADFYVIVEKKCDEIVARNAARLELEANEYAKQKQRIQELLATYKSDVALKGAER